MNSNLKTLVFWVVLICVAVLLFAVVRTGSGIREENITFSQFLDKVQEKQVKEVNISGSEVHGVYANGNGQLGFHTFMPANYPDIYNLLRTSGVVMNIKDASTAIDELKRLGD